MLLATYTKSPTEVQDYDIDFSGYLAAMNYDSVLEFAVTSDTGITVADSSLEDGVVKVWPSGGAAGHDYTITASVTTAAGRKREGSILIRVR